MGSEDESRTDERLESEGESEGDPEEALGDRLKVDPDAPPAKRNAAEPVEEPEPLKDQGDPLA